MDSQRSQEVERARQRNLSIIRQLQSTLQSAQQQEAHYRQLSLEVSFFLNKIITNKRL